VINVHRLTGEDHFLVDVPAAHPERLEAIVDSIACFGPGTTSLGLRTQGTEAVEPHSTR
jgi:Lrp/AsnC family leucine-responsive transcriptional regulator